MNFDLKMRYPAILRLSLLMAVLLLGLMQAGWAQEPKQESTQDASGAASAVAAGVAASHAAEPPVANVGLFDRYPAGSIASVDTANTALDDTAKEHQRIDVELIRQQRICYAKFFVSSCLNKVQAEYRTESKKIKNIEIEANTYLRQARADDRDAALAEQSAQDLADAPRRAEEQKQNAAENARKVEDSKRSTADAEARAQAPTLNPDQRIADHDKKMDEVRAKQAADAKMHDANVAAYNKKVKDAQDRQKEVADKKAAKAADLAAQRAAAQK